MSEASAGVFIGLAAGVTIASIFWMLALAYLLANASGVHADVAHHAMDLLENELSGDNAGPCLCDECVAKRQSGTSEDGPWEKPWNHPSDN